MGNKVLSQYQVQKDHPDYEAFRKSLFRLKLDGTHDPILRMAYMMGYVSRHNSEPQSLNAEILDHEFADFKEWLDDQCKGRKT